MLSNLAVSTHFGGISVAIESREKSPSVANSGCYVLARFGIVFASPQYRTLLRFRCSFESDQASAVFPNRSAKPLTNSASPIASGLVADGEKVSGALWHGFQSVGSSPGVIADLSRDERIRMPWRQHHSTGPVLELTLPTQLPQEVLAYCYPTAFEW